MCSKLSRPQVQICWKSSRKIILQLSPAKTPSDEVGSGSPVSSHVSPPPAVSSNNITLQPPVTHQLPSLDTESVNAITTKPASSQLSSVSPSTGIPLQIANNSSVPQNNLSQASFQML